MASSCLMVSTVNLDVGFFAMLIPVRGGAFDAFVRRSILRAS